MENLSQDRGVFNELEWKVVFGVIVHNIWTQRSNHVFNEDSWEGDIVLRIIGRVRDIMKAHKEVLL